MEKEIYTILVVDDEQSIRDLVGMILTRHGYHVLLAEQSDEALMRIEQFHGIISLMVTDLKMDPYMDGCELAKCVRLLRPEIRVLYISGLTENSMVHQEVSAGQANFVQKPFSVSEFLDSVRNILIRPKSKANHQF